MRLNSHVADLFDRLQSEGKRPRKSEMRTLEQLR